MKAKDKVITVSLSPNAYKSLHNLCFMSGVSVPKFAAALLMKFIQDPEKFVRVLDGTSSIDSNNNLEANASGADDLSK